MRRKALIWIFLILNAYFMVQGILTPSASRLTLALNSVSCTLMYILLSDN